MIRPTKRPGGILSRPFKLYISLLVLLALIGFKQIKFNSPAREIAAAHSNDCNDIVLSILSREKSEASIPFSQKKLLETPELRHFRFQQSIWNKVLGTREFNSFDENEYFRMLEIFKDERQSPDLLKINPVSIEHKLALIESLEVRYVLSTNHPGIQQEIEKLNAYKLRKLQKLLKKFDLSKKTTRENLEEFSSEFFMIIRGAPISVLDYFSVNKTKAMNERLFRTLEEDMLVRGLKNTLERIPESNLETSLAKAQAFVKKIRKYKAWRLLALPYDLPWIDRVKVSDELLEKILLDGLDAHQSELIVELKKQNAIDHYDRFRKVYRPIAYGAGVVFYYHKYQNYQKEADEKEEEENEEAKARFLNEFKKLSEAIHSGAAKEKSDEDIKEEQFQRVLNSFREKYHSEPTAEEYRELRKKIFGA